MHSTSITVLLAASLLLCVCASPDIENTRYQIKKPFNKDYNRCRVRCENGGKCVLQYGHEVCECPPHTTGQHCETVTDSCHSAPCRNGRCVNELGCYTCYCSEGYTGKQCETIIDYCESSPCVNGGECISEVGGYSCSCPLGYTDQHCETVIDYCESSPCVNGRCDPGVGYYTCFCKFGYTGHHCEIPDVTTTTSVTPVGDTEETYNCGSKNPCTPENISQKIFYFPHDEPNRFVQCSEARQCYEMDCPAGLVWDSAMNICNWPPPSI